MLIEVPLRLAMNSKWSRDRVHGGVPSSDFPVDTVTFTKLLHRVDELEHTVAVYKSNMMVLQQHTETLQKRLDALEANQNETEEVGLLHCTS